MKKLMLTLVTIISAGGHAAMFPIDQKTEFRLGDGVDPVTGQHFNPCIEFDATQLQKEASDEKAPLSVREAKLEVKQVTSHQEIDRYQNISVSGSFNYYGSGGGFSYNDESQFTLHSDQASLGISQEADYGRWYIRQPKLTAEMAKLAKKDPEQFYKLCGKEYIAGVVKGQGLRILMSTEANSVYSYRKIQATLNASYNGGVTSGSVEASFENTSKELIKNGLLKIHLFTYGSGPMKNSEALIRNHSDINAYRSVVADMIKEMKAEDAVAIRYISREYPGVVGKYNKIFADHQKQTFDLLYSIYRRLSDTRRRLSATMGTDFAQFADRECLAKYKEYCEDYVVELEAIAAEVEKSIKLVDDLAMKCAQGTKNGDCRLPTIKEVNMDVLLRAQWPMQFRYALYLQMLEDIRNSKKGQE